MTKNKRGLSRLSNRIEPSRKWTLDFVTACRNSSGLSRSRDEREFITARLSVGLSLHQNQSRIGQGFQTTAF